MLFRRAQPVILFSLLLLLTETVLSIPPSHWIAIDLPVAQNGSTVELAFRVRNGGSRVQAMVLSRSEAKRFDQGRSIRPLFASGFASSGEYRTLVPDAGNYVLLLDNRLEPRFPTRVSLSFDVTNPRDVRVRTVSPEVRRATVALSMLFFGAVVALSALKFLRS
jgi:hypothetical protein